MAGPAPGSEPQPQPPSSSAADEALKRNTDCVYFLASPLTCKKGSECEYRHSEVARVNPRDCYYWLHGNCLNPKCGFRHPPLDGLLGTQTPTSAGPSLPLTQNVPTPLTAHVPNASNKPGVPCIFFQKGFCLKGDWCPFLHGPNSMSNKGSLMPETASASETATFRKAVGDKKVVPINVVKPVKVSSLAKPAVEVEPALVRNEFPINKRVTHTSGVIEFPGYMNLPSVANGNPRVQPPYPVDEPGSMNYKDAEEVSREPSPGFDVLVDDERRDSDYYHSEDQYGISREHEVRNEYNIGHPTDYDTERGSDRYQDPLGYDSREHFKGQHAWEHRDIRSNSLERMSGGSSYPERRPYARKDNLGQVEELDLRHRLVKHKKANGLRSVINHEHARDRHAEDRSYQRFHREEHVSRGENSFGSRLRGRLRIPGRSSSPTDRDISRSRNQGRLSPVRAASSHQGRIRDRIKGNVEESLSSDGKHNRDSHLRRPTMDDNSADFAAPKSLAELKNKKNTEHSRHHVTDQLSLGKRKHLVLDGHQQSGDDLSFEGPKPLQEILKRKKGETIGVAGGRNSSNNEEITEDNNNLNKAQESVNKTETEEGSPYGRQSAPTPAASKVQAEDGGIIIEDGEYQETEAAYEQREGESDYEQAGGEEFEMYDGENGDAEGEEEYHDEDDDDDDFAKKMGVMYSEA